MVDWLLFKRIGQAFLELQILINLLLIEVVVRANLFRDADVLHVEDLCARQLIRILDGALANLLITDCHADNVGYCLLILSQTVEVVALISVLISL